MQLQQEREARRESQRIEKAERKKIREATRLRNSLMCDARAHVRIAAAAVLYGAAAEAQTPTRESAIGAQPVGPAVASLVGLNLRCFSLELLPSGWASLASLDLSHNELCQLPGIESLVSLTELDLCRNWFR